MNLPVAKNETQPQRQPVPERIADRVAAVFAIFRNRQSSPPSNAESNGVRRTVVMVPAIAGHSLHLRFAWRWRDSPIKLAHRSRDAPIAVAW